MKKVIKSKYKTPFLPENIETIDFCSVISIVSQDVKVKTEGGYFFIPLQHIEWMSLLTKLNYYQTKTELLNMVNVLGTTDILNDDQVPPSTATLSGPW